MNLDNKLLFVLAIVVLLIPAATLAGFIWLKQQHGYTNILAGELPRDRESIAKAALDNHQALAQWFNENFEELPIAFDKDLAGILIHVKITSCQLSLNLPHNHLK